MARLAPSIKSLLDLPDRERRLGPFFLIEQLGRGGFAPVWLAREVYGMTELRTAAVKLFSLELGSEGEALPSGRPSSTGSSAARARIVDEARALCQVEHPNVVRFYALPIDEARGVMGLAMEYVAGISLDKRIADKTRLSVADTLAVGVAVASALSAVHRAGLVHRDIKPGNIIEAAGIYKLIDFGIAAADALGRPRAAVTRSKPQIVELDDLPLEVMGSKLSNLSNLEEAMTQLDEAAGTERMSFAGIRCGTVGYIDPICLSTVAPATPASDLYALGATLFECLTGHVPAAAAMPEGRGLKGEVLDGRAPAPPLLTIAPETPKGLAAIIDSLLAVERNERPPSAEWTAIRLEQVNRELSGLARKVPPESVGPFRGLGRFEQGDRDIYFGRASEVAAALEVLRGRGVTALVGPSGSGKSSLARAGVLPAVAEGALGGWPKRWDTALAEPGHDPRATVGEALSRFVPKAASLSPEALLVALAERAQTTGAGLLLLVDQLEELATLAKGPSQAWLAALLARLGEQPLPGVRAVVAARRDLLDPLLSLGQLGRTLVRGLVLIEPITELTWGDVIDQALAAYGYTLEDEALKQELLTELKVTASAMPLVQFALTELWHKRDTTNKKITREGLRSTGGIAGALERHADRTLAEIAGHRAGAELTARALLLALTTPQGTRAAMESKELYAAAGAGGREVAQAFERARLIVPGPGGVTLAHEALLTQWGKLRTWVAEAREDRLLAEELERDAARFRADAESVPLWQRRRLVIAEWLLRRGGVRISEAAVAFLKASRRAERRLRVLVYGSIATTLLSVAGGGVVYVRSVQAQEATTREAMREEQASRALAEKRMHEVQAAQARVDELLRDLADSPTKAQVMALQEEIREAKSTPEPKEPEKEKEKKTPGPLTVTRPPGTAPSALPSAAPATSGTVAPVPTIKQQKEWKD
jgi:serine/threonine protein kinase